MHMMLSLAAYSLRLAGYTAPLLGSFLSPGGTKYMYSLMYSLMYFLIYSLIYSRGSSEPLAADRKGLMTIP